MRIAADVDVSAGGLLLGLVIGALLFFGIKLALGSDSRTAPYAFPVALLVAVAVFLLLGFDIHGDVD